ncbi:uncharacterized protein ciroz [Pundamilia nyererei]|uniref:Uncharacterized protein ciroz n=1 Tax=Pundamilia nyererei TaxID=303518 RepID=A0A9Y3RB64_9CICH|nr:PREDICTED: uncharacterized protein C1orf127 homolog [Pundamilia nyererei]
MDHIRVGILAIFLQCFITKSAFFIQKQEWIQTSAARLTEDVVCFPEYMEMWMHSARIEEFRVWLSRALSIQANLASLDHLNLQLSACGFSLQNDPDDNYVFRVSYTGCFVRQQNGFNVLTLNLVRRMNRFGSQHHSFTMKCPVMSVVQSREQILCDPEYVQVIREIPYGNWDNELQWSLCLDDHLLVALEDASLIQMNIDVNVTDIRVQGRRREILRPVNIMENEGEFLDLKLVRDRYAYSMEATCPKVNASTADKTVLHILKRRMGLTRRGTDHNEALTLSDLSVIQTVTFTVHETSEFVTLSIPTAQILQTKPCTDDNRLLQPFYRVDAVLTFRETNHKMHWTMESTLPCIAAPKNTSSHVTSSPGPNNISPSTLDSTRETVTTDEPLPDLVTIPEENLKERDSFKPAKFPTTNLPHMQREGRSFNIHADEIIRDDVSTSVLDNGTSIDINTNTTSLFDFLHAATNVSVESDLLTSAATAQTPHMSLTTLAQPDEEHQELNTTSRNEQQQKEKKPQWIW